MAVREDVEKGETSVQEEIREPLIQQQKKLPDEENQKDSKRQLWMVYLSTFVAVCGSYEFGCCAGYSSPTQSAIREDLGLSLSEYSVFGSILTFGAMIGAITSGKIADFIGRKGAMRISTAFCVAGWLAIYFAEGALSLDIGRFATGYGMGVFSYVLMITSGVSVAFIIGTVLSWRALALTGKISVLNYGSGCRTSAMCYSDLRSLSHSRVTQMARAGLGEALWRIITKWPTPTQILILSLHK